MKLLVAYRMGVNMQGIVGIFSERKKAMDALKIAKKEERDNYHTFHIYQTTLDAITDPDETSFFSNEENEVKSLKPNK